MTPNSKVCKGLPGSPHLETCGSGFGFGLRDRPRGYVSDPHRPPPRFILSRPGVGARGARLRPVMRENSTARETRIPSPRRPRRNSGFPAAGLREAGKRRNVEETWGDQLSADRACSWGEMRERAGDRGTHTDTDRKAEAKNWKEDVLKGWVFRISEIPGSRISPPESWEWNMKA